MLTADFVKLLLTLCERRQHLAKVLDLLLWALEARPSASEGIIKTVSAVGEQNKLVH